MNDKPVLISAGQLVDGRGGAPVAGAGVLVDAGRPDVLGPAALGPSSVVLHVPEPVLGVDVPLAEEEVMDGAGLNVGDAEAVADFDHRSG